MKWGTGSAVVGILLVGLFLVLWWPQTPPATSPNESEPALPVPEKTSATQQAPEVPETPVVAASAPRRVPVPPVLSLPPAAVSPTELAQQDPAAFAAIMNGLQDNRYAIRDCVFKLKREVSRPQVLEWTMVLDVQVEADDTARITEAQSEDWPEQLSDELRECFKTSFAGFEFSTEELFAYRFAYPMQLSVTPSGGD